MDELMEDYHDGVPTPRQSVDHVNGHNSRMSKQLSAMDVEEVKKDEGAGLFQFGRQLAASFNPTTLWRKLWNEPRDDTVQQGMEEAVRKARQKVEAEERYEQMKRSGQLGLQPVSRAAPYEKSETETPRDSGIEIDGFNHSRSMSQASGLLHPLDSESEALDTASKPNKGLKSRLHFKKPSLSNMKNDLKRVGSDLNLAATIRRRESSSSLSPVKTDVDNSALRRSESRYDLKKQQKLHKRVSDLEAKLAHARSDLNDALVEASPAPRLTSKYERFVPSGTMKRPKFIPGKLPSLPSERILMAEEAVAAARRTLNNFENEDEPRNAIDLTNELDEEEVRNDTIRASRAHRYPKRASSLFNLDNQHIEKPTQSAPNDNDNHHQNDTEVKAKTTEPADAENMDPNNITSTSSDAPTDPAQKANYASLDAKLKALDANVKLARKEAKPKKRKSGAKDDDKLFKPGRAESDDDAEWEEVNPTPKKKRKSGSASSPPGKRGNGATGKTGSPQGKKKGGATTNAETVSSSPKGKAKESQQTVDATRQRENGDAEVQEDDFSADEASPADEEQPARTSLDSQGHPLDVVYEEEEETSKGPLNDDASKRTAQATSTRFAGFRTRSNSPHKRSRSVQPAGVEETMLTRAAQAAKANPARRAGSPPPARSTTNGAVMLTEEEEVVKVRPGVGGVPKLPKGATGSFESLDGEWGGLDVEEETVIVGTDGVARKARSKGSFEWPEDVF
jgi:hypothetical protein